MRWTLLGLIAAAAASGCGPEGPKKAASEEVVAGAANPGALWPLMLRHCLHSPSCDPMSDFGQGAGQASGMIEQVSYFVESADVVKEGGEDYGAAITLSLYSTPGQGGAAGRPLSLEEAPDSLRATNARRSRLAIEYRTPGGGAPEPYFLTFRSAQLVLKIPSGPAPKNREEIISRTGDHVAGLSWGPGDDGAKIEVGGEAGVLWSGYSIGMESGDEVDKDYALKRRFEPWVFFLSRNLRDEPLPKLMAAIAAGETLSLRITAPGGGEMLSGPIYTVGYSEALREATEALRDPGLVKSVPDRCSIFADKDDTFWKIADVTAALRTCDTRTAARRRSDELNAPPLPAPQ